MKPDIDYKTRDRDGAAVCYRTTLTLPSVGVADLEPTPDGEFALAPVDSGLRLSPWWIPPARVLPG